MVLFAIALFAVLALWTMYKVIVYALPCLIGYSAALMAFGANAGWLGATIAGLAAAVLSFFLVRFLIAQIQSTRLRWTIAALLAFPSALLAYNLALDVLASEIPSDAWRHTLSTGFAIASGCMAFVRLTDA